MRITEKPSRTQYLYLRTYSQACHAGLIRYMSNSGFQKQHL